MFRRQTQTAAENATSRWLAEQSIVRWLVQLPTFRRRVAAGLVAVTAAMFVTACGQVITVQPTPTPEPTATLSVAVVVATLPPTATPAPYTPEPTPTPTVTPTPVLHAIQSGESLLGIANLYGISVAALQETNGILDPRFLQIGEQLIIPRQVELEAASGEDATPTPTPLALDVENVLFNETAIGGLSVLGEVVNTSGTALEQVRVGVTLLDAAGAEIGRADGLVALDLVDVQERAPFAVLFGELPGEFARYQVYPMRAVPAYVGSYYRDLAVADLEFDGERYASYTVTGRILNTGPEEAVQVQVVLTAYDPLGRVVATRKVDPDHNVVPLGGETTFTAVLSPAGGPVERIAAEAQGRRISAAQP